MNINNLSPVYCKAPNCRNTPKVIRAGYYGLFCEKHAQNNREHGDPLHKYDIDPADVDLLERQYDKHLAVLETVPQFQRLQQELTYCANKVMEGQRDKANPALWITMFEVVLEEKLKGFTPKAIFKQQYRKGRVENFKQLLGSITVKIGSKATIKRLVTRLAVIQCHQYLYEFATPEMTEVKFCRQAFFVPKHNLGVLHKPPTKEQLRTFRIELVKPYLNAITQKLLIGCETYKHFRHLVRKRRDRKAVAPVVAVSNPPGTPMTSEERQEQQEVDRLKFEGLSLADRIGWK